MTFKELIKLLQERLNEKGERLKVDGDPGPKTQAALSDYSVDILLIKNIVKDPAPSATPGTSGNPAYNEAKKYEGKGEHDPEFRTWLAKRWPLVKLNLGTIVGSFAAWCALFFGVMNTDVGQKVILSGLAKETGKSGYEIDYRKNGIPQGAGVWKNSFSCSSGSGNHITWSDGDCTAEDILKPKATWAGFGGNQNNKVQRSIYCAKGDCRTKQNPDSDNSVICRVFWHEPILPPPVKQSKNCTGKAVKESTR